MSLVSPRRCLLGFATRSRAVLVLFAVAFGALLVAGGAKGFAAPALSAAPQRVDAAGIAGERVESVRCVRCHPR